MPLWSSTSFPKSIFVFNHGKIKCSAPYVPHQHTQGWKTRQEGRTLEIVVVVEQLRPDGAVAEEVREVVERGMLEVLEHVVEPGLEHVVRAVHVELEQLRCLMRRHGVSSGTDGEGGRNMVQSKTKLGLLLLHGRIYTFHVDGPTGKMELGRKPSVFTLIPESTTKMRISARR